tara:strand:- start:48 stop:530 length:483 start_codon:yes stop_codon:yes gene_type:complete
MKCYDSGKPETISGRGSTLEYTEGVRAELPNIIKTYNIKSMFDAGSGDRHWISQVDLGCEYYCGDLPDYDLLRDNPPEVDLFFCRDVLIHIPPEQQEHIKWGNCKYYMLTFYYPGLVEYSYPGFYPWYIPESWDKPIRIVKEKSKLKYMGIWTKEQICQS